MSFLRVFSIAAVALLLGAPPARGQLVDSGRSGVKATRAELQQRLAEYERGNAPQMTPYEAAVIRQRLAEGDFQTGDRVMVVVEGEEALSDTFTVQPGPVLVMPVVGEIPLRGVLRTEAEQHIRQVLARQLRNPVVHVQPLIRIPVLGQVGNPGFYLLSPDALVTDAVMRAGGPTQNAELTKIKIERGDRELWKGETLQEAIVQGRTLDQLSLQTGDRIVVPEKRTFNFRTLLYIVPALVGLTTLISRL